MKKICIAFALVAFSLVLASCASAPSDTGVSQAEFDSIKGQYETLQNNYDSLQRDYNSAKSDLDAANKQIEDLLALIAAAEAEAEAEINEDPASVDVFVYEDDYVEIRFIGCELDRNDEQLVFMVTNKTDSELTFQSGTMSIDGLSLGHVSGSDSIAAQSKGKVRFETREDFPTMNPETISGTIKVIDFGKTLWGSQSYEVAFSKLEVQ